MTGRLWLAAGVLALAAIGGRAAAAGFYAQEQSVEGLGRAYSGEAAGGGADTLWWNPAGIADVEGTSTYSGLQVVDANVDVTNAGSTIQRPGQSPAPVGGNADSKPFDISEIPNFAVARRLNDQWAVGLAITAPFGFAAVSSPDAWTRFEAIKVRLIDLDFQPTLAWRPTSWLRLGVGGDAEIADTKFSIGLPNLSALEPDGRANLAVNGWNFGWVAGAQIKPTDAFTVGLSYRSSIGHSLGGHVTTTGLLAPLVGENMQSVTNVQFSTPWLATLGARWRLDDRWTLEAQAQRVGWSEFDGFAINTVGQPPTLTGQKTRDTTSVAVGVDYAATKALTLRAGVQEDPQAIRDTAVLPDGDRLIMAAGASWRKSARTAFDVAAAYVDFAHTPIESNLVDFAGTPVATPVHLVGDLAAHAFVLSVGMREQF